MADRARNTNVDEATLDVQAEVGAVAAEVKSVAGDLKSAAVEHTKSLLEGAKQQATSFADERKNEAAGSVADIAASLRETGKNFGERPNIQAFVDNAADGLDQLASGLRERSFAELYGDAEAYARRSPVVVGAVAVAAGFLLARFIKASADDLSQTSAAARSAGQARRARAAKADA